MLRGWLIRLLCWLLGEQALPVQPSAPERSVLAIALEHYQQALDELKGGAGKLLPVLLARDQVESALAQTRAIAAGQVQQLVALDGQLRQQAQSLPADLSKWRSVVHPPNTAWWWYLDQEEREKENDLPWILLTGTLLTLTVPLTLEIVKRLWDGAPDRLSVFGTLLTLLITGSPLFKRGQELAQWVLQRLPWIKPRYRAEAMAAMAALAFVLVLAGRLWALPHLAVYYNNAGHAELRAGNLTAAQQAFQRAVALDPGKVVPYQNLADVYQQIGRPQDAIAWYQKAIERDLNFGPAYSSLGHLYNTQGDFVLAEQILLAGLARVDRMQDAALQIVIRYQLLSDLGWSYLGQKRLDRARDALEQAIALESELKTLGEQKGVEYRLALPHLTLAQVYEQLDRPQEAKLQWEESLRFLDPNNWADREQIDIALKKLGN